MLFSRFKHKKSSELKLEYLQDRGLVFRKLLFYILEI